MKKLQNVGDQPHLLMDSPQSDSGGLLKTGIFSFFLHIFLISLLIFNLKTGTTKSAPTVYRVTIKPLSFRDNSKPPPLQALPSPKPIPEKPQIKKEKNKPKKEVLQIKPVKEAVKQSEPVEEPKQLPEPLPRPQVDDQTIQEPIPLPMAETSTLDTDSNLEKEDILPIPTTLSPVESNKNTPVELGGGDRTGTGTGTGNGGSTPGGSVKGEGTGEGSTGGGSRWGWLGSTEGTGPGRGASGAGRSGEGSGSGEGGSGSGGLGKETGTGRGSGIGIGDGTGKGGGLGGFEGGRFRGSGSRGAPPRYVENPKPPYPLEAKNKAYEGKVLLQVEVLSNGRVGEIFVKESSGYDVLDQSALDTVKKWRFIPARKGGIAIPCWVNIPITFKLKDISF
jgi:TonB family protein